MSTIIKTEVFLFDELTDEAKEKAREWYREGALDYEWWEFIYETAKTAGTCLGIDVDQIYFSGFWSQGDGACFTGSYAYRKGWRKALRAEFGGETLDKLTTIGEALQAAQKPAFYKLAASVKNTNRGNDEYSVTIDVDTRDVPETGGRADEDELAYTLRSFMRWIYRQLEAEYDWLMSDEQVDESIRANEYTFTVDGKRFG